MPLDIMRPFTRAEGKAAGISDRQLRGPDFQPLLGGVYLSSRVRDLSRSRATAAVMVHPRDAVATHFSSARVVGAPVPDHPLEHVTVARAEDRRQRHGIRCHVAALSASDIAVVDGLRISEPHRLFVEMAPLLTLVELVVLGDWLVRHGHLTTTSLVEYCARTTARHAAAAATAASYVRSRVDSPMETRLRMLLVLAGLPEPSVNLRLVLHEGTAKVRLDLSYPTVKVAVEYDGRQHVEVVQQWQGDLDRREELDDGDWRIIVVTSRGIYREPEKTLLRVWRALHKRRFRPLAPPTDGWRVHFGH
ncbi:MAG: hypothetical protein AVDCRST_MAG47-1529 [uncultured Nocardioidaceae bacterium]|uniref:DUF559 domain-containing protein n=1 Tax=uncultured Nocardioidaceae bacterium TaxID=253824 RepID=A0A6J4N6P9_9ACTN|nr:MAG: hypothetical protein AVDCRST_MAG47-1529 [uncultured Nocardioidaceae bacterium]